MDIHGGARCPLDWHPCTETPAQCTPPCTGQRALSRRARHTAVYTSCLVPCSCFRPHLANSTQHQVRILKAQGSLLSPLSADTGETHFLCCLETHSTFSLTGITCWAPPHHCFILPFWNFPLEKQPPFSLDSSSSHHLQPSIPLSRWRVSRVSIPNRAVLERLSF